MTALWTVAMVGCGGEDSPGDEPGPHESSSSGGSSSGVSSSSGGSSGASSSGASSSGEPGPGSSSGGSSSGEPQGPTRPTGPGPAPSRSCSYSADGQGFFELKTEANQLAYWVRLPANYNASTPYPLAIVAHGCGDNAKNFATWAAAPWEMRGNQTHIAVSVGAGRDGSCWNREQDEPKLLEVLDDVRSCFYADDRKIVIGGYSSGGQLAYYVALRNALRFAGVLIENSAMPFGGQTDAVLADAAWKLPFAITARQSDGSFGIGTVRGNRDALQAAGFPVTFRELPGGHDGTGDDWRDFLLPAMFEFVAE